MTTHDTADHNPGNAPSKEAPPRTLAPPTTRLTKPRIAIALLALALMSGAFGLYIQVADHEFLYFDDAVYVTQNEMIQRGLTLESIGWAFTSGQGANWFPITRLSHMLDVELFGQSPRGPHLTNAFIHACATALLFIFLVLATQRLWTSAIVAALFAVHPLHVESVAWVSGRKDVLSALFWFAALLAYVPYVRRRTPLRYLAIVLFFVLSFMSKPVAVALPLTLLILDFWPFARHTADSARETVRRATGLVIEKIPLFALTVLFSWIAYATQRQGGTMDQMGTLSIATRIGNALLAYATYFLHTLWPRNLYFPYPHPGNVLPAWLPIEAAAYFGLVAVAVYAVIRRQKHIIAGSLWFVITLVPVIGLVQIGFQASADRYMYIPITGLLIAACYWTTDRTANRKSAQIMASAAAIIAIGLLSIECWNQQQYWRNSETVLTRAIEVNDQNVPAYIQLGVVHLMDDHPGKAESVLRKALAIDPLSAPIYSNLGSALRMQNKVIHAAGAFRQAIEFDPTIVEPHLNLGTLLLAQDQPTMALPYLQTAVALNPKDPFSRYFLARAYIALQDHTRALHQIRVVLELDPQHEEAKALLNQLPQTVQETSNQ